MVMIPPNKALEFMEEGRIYTPFPKRAELDDNVVAVGGDLSPDLLISAYSQGVFPWFTEDEPILWWSLDPRFVLFPSKLKISGSMKKIIRQQLFNRKEIKITLDTAFQQVIESCAQTPRKNENGTWITSEMIEAYCRLYREGVAHSVEVWRGDQLTGGLYGVSLGKIFFGESMFTKESNHSKIAFTALVLFLRRQGFLMIDCQQTTAHLGSLGAEEIPIASFMDQLEKGFKYSTARGNWGDIYTDFSLSDSDISGSLMG